MKSTKERTQIAVNEYNTNVGLRLSTVAGIVSAADVIK